MNRRVVIGGLLGLAACATPAEQPDAGADAGPPARPRRLDVLAITTLGDWSFDFRDRVGADMTQRLLARLVKPPAGRPVRDLHFGTLHSQIGSIPGLCRVAEGPADGTLYLPRTDPQPPGRDGGVPWPPRERYLTSAAIPLEKFPLLALTMMVTNDNGRWDCSVTQFLEAARLATDGRNPGFLRPDALLLLLFFADREDCSTTDLALWAPGPWQQESGINARCAQPPPGLLYPVERYVNAFAALQPSGRVYAALFAKVGPSKIKSKSPDGGPAILVPFLCSPSVEVGSTLRMKAVLDGLALRRDPRLHAAVIDPCPPDQLPPLVDKLADEILALMDR